uniref:Uncharacterized protein n=1 Tax=Rhodnius prolixus TaxID=13249 RepID=T1HKK6_RHOPR
MKLYSVFFLFSVLSTVYCGVCWTTYPDTEYRGDKLDQGCLDSGECKTYASSVKAQAHSISMIGGCVSLWEYEGCSD